MIGLDDETIMTDMTVTAGATTETETLAQEKRGAIGTDDHQ